MMAKQVSQEDTQAQTREQVKQQQREAKAKKEAGASGRIRIRLIPIWLRVVIVTMLIAASLVSGLMIGYGVIGDGNPKDALKKKTWTHIIDLVQDK